MFLTDVFIIENLQILEEASSDKPMKVRGIFQRAEEANNNYVVSLITHQTILLNYQMPPTLLQS